MKILRIAVNSPLRCLFDYLPPDDPSKQPAPGQRVKIPFGRGKPRIGLIIKLSSATQIPCNRLKKVLQIIDKQPLLTQEQLYLIEWSSRYYHHPIGEVAFISIPPLLRKTEAITVRKDKLWQIAGSAQKDFDINKLARAKKQSLILNFIKQHPNGISQTQINKKFGNSYGPLNALLAKKLIKVQDIPAIVEPYLHQADWHTRSIDQHPIKANAEQQHAIDKIIAASTTHQIFLLDGITGSGKTEIYLQIIQHFLDLGKQILIMTPEIVLLPQLVKTISTKFSKKNIVVLNSGLSGNVRTAGWLAARSGQSTIVLGTRSAVWTPMPNLGMIIIDEEHDISYKQQDKLRYSSRDLALIRGQRKKIPILLGSATPSMESIKNTRDGRYQLLQLSNRVNQIRLPNIYIHDIGDDMMHGAISAHLLKNIKQRLHNKQQTLLFLNRRGYAPVMMCHNCNYIFRCSHCSSYITFHKAKGRLICHHCGYSKNLLAPCPGCSKSLPIKKIGYGTERLLETLSKLLPKARILRIDRDTTQRKGAMESILEDIHAGRADILIGTQMLAKGHHFPRVTLVGIIDTDQALFSLDYRASERMAQIFMQVSGRAGRKDTPGDVIVQTRYPNHPLIKELAGHNYRQFAQLLLKERQQAKLPPFSFQALIRAEAVQKQAAVKFLSIARKELQVIAKNALDIYGPIMAPMEKRGGRYRLQLLIQADNRKAIQKFLSPWITLLDQLPEARGVKWSVDIDPYDIA